MTALVLIGLAVLALYTMFSGPTTVPLPAQQRGAPAQTAPATPGEEDRGEQRD
ncbi:MAG: hypothetical protein WBM00_11905 [Solirubrobacterales bacterium]